MPPVAAVAVAVAFVLDHAVGEFPERLHPVALYGSVIERVDRDWRRPQLVGSLCAVALPIAAGAVAGGLVAIGGWMHPGVQSVIAGGVLFVATSRRMLVDVARETIDLSRDRPGDARERLPALVGRDPDELSEGEIRSAAVESAGENLSDGLVAPLLAFVVFGWWPPVAAGAAAWVKAVNTGDSMLGYPEKPMGRAFARLDDAVMWLPARLSALLIAAVALDPFALGRARRWARRPASPNAGWPMAALAAVLDVRLTKPDAYRLNPAAALPSADQARQGVRIVNRSGVVAFAGAVVVAWW